MGPASLRVILELDCDDSGAGEYSCATDSRITQRAASLGVRGNFIITGLGLAFAFVGGTVCQSLRALKALYLTCPVLSRPVAIAVATSTACR